METSELDSVEKIEVVQPSALEAIERASVDMQITTAKKYPRMLSKVKDDMITFATLDEETARSCFWTLPRGGKTLQGPSIRLAEIAISCYGNLRAGARVISTQTTGDNPHVVVQAVTHDLEKNVAITIEKRGRIFAKRGKSAPDEDDINIACNRCAAIALRDAIFKVVPMALIKPVYERAKRVAIGDATSLAKKRFEVMDRLKAIGATEDRILAVVECRKVEDINLEKLETLIGLGTALKDGEVTLEEAFPPKEVRKPIFGGKKDAEEKHGDLDAAEPPADPAAREKLIEEFKNWVLNNNVTEKALLKSAVEGGFATGKEADVWELPTAALFKLFTNRTGEK